MAQARGGGGGVSCETRHSLLIQTAPEWIGFVEVRADLAALAWGGPKSSESA